VNVWGEMAVMLQAEKSLAPSREVARVLDLREEISRYE
jgi:hypothetical protein